MTTRSERFQSLALAAILAIGAGLAWTILFIWGMTIVEGIIGSREPYEQIAYLRDGTPIIQSYTGDYRGANLSHAGGKAGGGR